MSEPQAHPAGPQPARHRELRWEGRLVRVTTPVPAEVWQAVAAADPTALPFHTPRWRDCVCAGSRWRDASRLYETAGGRHLVLMMASRDVGPGLALEASWPAGWGSGGALAPGGLRPQEAAMLCSDIARGRAVSTSLRPSFAAAHAWPADGRRTIPHEVHVAHLRGLSFDEYLARCVSARQRHAIRSARRHLDRAGVTISSGNSPELVRALYDVYLRWIEWRAGQRKMPGALARWQGRRAEPYSKFAAVAGGMGDNCRIWVAWWQGRPVGSCVSLYGGRAAVGWRAFTDRSVPDRFRLFEVLAAGALRHACESGCDFLEMGESVGRENLAHIKARLGGTRHEFSEYCFERVPLIPARMAFQRLRRQAEDLVLGHRRQTT